MTHKMKASAVNSKLVPGAYGSVGSTGILCMKVKHLCDATVQTDASVENGCIARYSVYPTHDCI